MNYLYLLSEICSSKYEVVVNNNKSKIKIAFQKEASGQYYMTYMALIYAVILSFSGTGTAADGERETRDRSRTVAGVRRRVPNETPAAGGGHQVPPKKSKPSGTNAAPKAKKPEGKLKDLNL